MIRLKTIDTENIEDVLALRIRDDQKGFVISTAESLAKVTKILQDEFYDYSYIHYTYETNWYSKLGYKTFLKWNCKGIIGEDNE